MYQVKRGSFRNNEYSSRRVWHPAKPEGLARTLAKAGYGTRAQTAEIVRSGRIVVEGETVSDPALAVGPDTEILMDGSPLVEAVRRYFAFHKPLRVVCRRGDPRGRKLVADFLPADIVGLQAAGRLDGATSGLLLISNDNPWNGVAETARGLDREYYAKVTGKFTEMERTIVTAGTYLQQHGAFRPQSIEILNQAGNTTELRIVVKRGANRLVRLVFRSLRLEVTTLRRVRIGEIALGDLAPGSLRALSPAEVAFIRRLHRPGGRAR